MDTTAFPASSVTVTVHVLVGFKKPEGAVVSSNIYFPTAKPVIVSSPVPL